MKRKLVGVILVNIVLISIAVTSGYYATHTPVKLPESIRLSVPYHNQGDKPWCVAACLIMVLDFYSVKPLPSLSYIAYLVYNSRISFVEVAQSYGLNVTAGQGGTFQDAMKDLNIALACQQPVVISLWTNTTNNPSRAWISDKTEWKNHAVVITGYDSGGVYMSNPWPNGGRSLSGGCFLTSEWLISHGWIPAGPDNYISTDLFQRLWKANNFFMEVLYKTGQHQPLTPLYVDPMTTSWFYIVILDLLMVAIMGGTAFALSRRKKSISAEYQPGSLQWETNLCPRCRQSLTFIPKYYLGSCLLIGS